LKRSTQTLFKSAHRRFTCRSKVNTK